jgi:hypothetical protein
LSVSLARQSLALFLPSVTRLPPFAQRLGSPTRA